MQYDLKLVCENYGFMDYLKCFLFKNYLSKFVILIVNYFK